MRKTQWLLGWSPVRTVTSALSSPTRSGGVARLPSVHVLLYTWSSCSFCARARTLLLSHGIRFQEQEIDGDRARVEQLTKLFGRRTMPFVLVDGEPLGGIDELEKALAAGTLGE